SLSCSILAFPSDPAKTSFIGAVLQFSTGTTEELSDGGSGAGDEAGLGLAFLRVKKALRYGTRYFSAVRQKTELASQVAMEKGFCGTKPTTTLWQRNHCSEKAPILR